MSHDRRGRVLEAAVFNPDLTNAQKVFMVVVVTIRAEHIDGERRHGSRAMTPDGSFSLHRDYLALALNVTPNVVKKLRTSLVRKGFLRLVHDGAYGRPPTWQAQVVRGATTDPLTYRPPVGRNHTPTVGASPPVGGDVEDRRNPPPPSASPAAFDPDPLAAASPETRSRPKPQAGRR